MTTVTHGPAPYLLQKGQDLSPYLEQLRAALRRLVPDWDLGHTPVNQTPGTMQEVRIRLHALLEIGENSTLGVSGYSGVSRGIRYSW